MIVDGKRILRVFPKPRNSYTPCDDFAFVGDPPMFRPKPEDVDEVWVSGIFTWGVAECKRLAGAWGQYYPVVRFGGPAFGDSGEIFTPGLFVKEGIVITSRGCIRHCSFCLVAEREGSIRELPITDGWIVQDNNLLACSKPHIDEVFSMLRQQKQRANFPGGLDTRLMDGWAIEQLKTIRIEEIFLAADSASSIKPLREVTKHLSTFLSRRQMRCYVMVGFGDETIEEAENRLQDVWDAGCLPFCQLFQPPADKRKQYSGEWISLNRRWSRPAATFASQEKKNERR